MAITGKMFSKLAKLVQVEFDPAEEEQVNNQLNYRIGMLSSLDGVETNNIKPSFAPFEADEDDLDSCVFLTNESQLS